MGGNLCTLRHLRHATLSGHSDIKDGDMPTERRASYVDNLKPKCLKIEEQQKKTNQEITRGKDRMTTLEEWLLSSPGFEIDSLLRRQSPKVCPLSCSYAELSPHPRENSSGEGAMVEGEEGRGLVSLNRSQSGNGKRVSFKLPEKDGIHIIHTHDD